MLAFAPILLEAFDKKSLVGQFCKNVPVGREVRLSVNGAFYLQEVKMTCPKCEEFFGFNTQSSHCECTFVVQNGLCGAKITAQK